MQCDDSRLVNISSLMPLNFFSISPRKSSIASASLPAASLVPGLSIVAVLVDGDVVDGLLLSLPWGYDVERGAGVGLEEGKEIDCSGGSHGRN